MVSLSGHQPRKQKNVTTPISPCMPFTKPGWIVVPPNNSIHCQHPSEVNLKVNGVAQYQKLASTDP